MNMSSRIDYLRGDEVFGLLCDMVASDHLVCMTGAGVSTGLSLKNGAGTMPEWGQLLDAIYRKLISSLNDVQKSDVEALLKNATGEELIEVASILYQAESVAFENAFLNALTLREGETTDAHRKLLALCPRGILTFNYDKAHENALQEENLQWDILLPFKEQRLLKALQRQLRTPFLLKAHGTLEDFKSIVLTRESYRDLFIKFPTYRAFMQNILTNYQLLIVGFSLSDPDFDMLIQNVFSIYGSPLQKHVVIKHEDTKTAKDTLYRLRYGLHFLYVRDFADIPVVLDACMHTLGPEMVKIINLCTDGNREVRSGVHRSLPSLSVPGRKCLANVIEEKIRMLISQETDVNYSGNTELSEWVYTYRMLDIYSEDHKKFLIEEVIEKSVYVEPIAHAMATLRNTLQKSDLPIIERWIQRFKTPTLHTDAENPDPDNKLFVYANYLRVYVRAKERAFD
jgi:hypothetical protein